MRRCASSRIESPLAFAPVGIFSKTTLLSCEFATVSVSAISLLAYHQFRFAVTAGVESTTNKAPLGCLANCVDAPDNLPFVFGFVNVVVAWLCTVFKWMRVDGA